jgi:hypothetical protein
MPIRDHTEGAAEQSSGIWGNPTRGYLRKQWQPEENYPKKRLKKN